MSEFMLESHTLHLWHLSITDLAADEHHLVKLLDDAEIERANRFRFAEHRLRFIITHGILREILSRYTAIPAQEIIYSYGQRGKPFLQDNPLNLQFNMSHSGDLAIYALTIGAAIGVDIEKVEHKFNDDVAKRFFSEQEYQALIALPEAERINAFYRLWAAKEALIKAVGEGLYVPLGSFSIELQQPAQWVSLTHANQPRKLYLENVRVPHAYQAAFASEQLIDRQIHWQWGPSGPVIIR